MAGEGIRFLSENLSGFTVQVTYLSDEGGDPSDLGTLTMPFNYIAPHFTGTYEIYVPYYDKTYIHIFSDFLKTIPFFQSSICHNDSKTNFND